MWTQVGPRNYALDQGPDLLTGRALLRGMTSGFSYMLPCTISSGPNVGISLHAVDKHSDWPAAEALKQSSATLNFPSKKITPLLPA